MKRIIILLMLMVFCASIFSQEKPRKNSIGFQANILLDENLYNGAFIQPVWALRYGYHYSKNLSFGPEISGTRTFWRSSNVRDTKQTTLTIGGFSRYTFLSKKRVSPFVELSLYDQYSRFVPGVDPVFNNMEERTSHKFTGYVAPGISIKSKSRKFSFDLMYKFSPDRFINYKEAVLSYRLNFYF